MNKIYMQEAIKLAQEGIRQNQGGPFGAVVVKNGEIIGRGNNQVLLTLDPTAHAEVVAIRQACQYINNFSLEGCEVYTSCEPCPMCLTALYWARVDKIYYGANRHDAKMIGFDDELFYQELEKSPDQRQVPLYPLLREEALTAFQQWQEKPDKVPY